MDKVFAQGRERTEDESWLIYPRDYTLRKSMYPDEELLKRIGTHPAKMNAYLFKDIVEYVSEPGEHIVDCFGGAGTSLIAACLGRNVTLIEIEEYYVAILNDCKDHLSNSGQATGRMTIINADNRLVLPFPCDHIITSPPYGNDLAKEAESVLLTSQDFKDGKVYGQDVGIYAEQVEQYGKATQNMGRMNPFIYKQEMKKLYAKMAASIRPGGTITITHRDRIRDNERVLYIQSIVEALVKCGMRPKMLDKWKAPGSIQSRVNEKLGNEVVLDEDIICMEKPL